MANNFDWQNEEDSRHPTTNWDEPPTQPAPRPTRRVPWRLIGVVAVLAAVLGAIIWWRVDRRIDATMQAVRADVIASHNLAQRAGADGDEEIFRTVLSGRDPSWTAGELQVFTERLLVDRAPFGLQAPAGALPAILPLPQEEADAAEAPADVEFSARLDEAIVTVDLPYETADGETVVLEQTSVYRRGDQRWLLAPPLPEFWGESRRLEGNYLNVIYPARDEAIAQRLAADLDAEIARLCATAADLNCSQDLQLTLRLDDDPAALAALATPLGALRRAQQTGDILELPAPTLVGLPTGDESEAEAGYQALRDGYARHLLAAVVARVVNWECCRQELLFQLLYEYQLSELGLQPWPVGAADYQSVLDNRTRVADLGAFVRPRDPVEALPEQVAQMRAAVDFLVHAIPDNSAANMQRVLATSSHFAGFIASLLAQERDYGDQSWILSNLDHAWWLYAWQGTLEPQPAPPEPDEDLYLACTSLDGSRDEPSMLLRYLPETGDWEELLRRNGFIWTAALADPRALLVQEFDVASETWQTGIWRDGGLTLAFADPNSEYAISLGETDPNNRYLVGYTLGTQTGETIKAIDLTACDGGCATNTLPALPAWSPSGEWALYVGTAESLPESTLLTANQRSVLLDSSAGFHEQPIQLGSGDVAAGTGDLVPVGNGYSPFWLDDETFGFIQESGFGLQGPRGEQRIVLGTAADPTLQTILTGSDLYQFLPDNINERGLTLGYVAAHPRHPGKLFIVVFDAVSERSYVFLYDMETGLAELRLRLLYDLNHSLGFSPDGRYLVMTGNDRSTSTPGDMTGTLLLHDIAANRTTPFLVRLPFFLSSFTYDWTADGRWLAIAMNDNLVGLVAPEAGYARLLTHSHGACASVGWVRP